MQTQTAETNNITSNNNINHADICKQTGSPTLESAPLSLSPLFSLYSPLTTATTPVLGNNNQHSVYSPLPRPSTHLQNHLVYDGFTLPLPAFSLQDPGKLAFSTEGNHGYTQLHTQQHHHHRASLCLPSSGRSLRRKTEEGESSSPHTPPDSQTVSPTLSSVTSPSTTSNNLQLQQTQEQEEELQTSNIDYDEEEEALLNQPANAVVDSIFLSVSSNSLASSPISYSFSGPSVCMSSVSSPVLTMLRSQFDDARKLSAEEERQWTLLLSRNPCAYHIAQCKLSQLHGHLDDMLKQMASEYEKGIQQQQLGGHTMQSQEQMQEVVKGIAGRFSEARDAVLQLHLFQADKNHQEQDAVSVSSSSHEQDVSMVTTSAGGSSASASSSSVASTNAANSKVKRPRRAKKMNPAPPNSTSTKRSYFDKSRTVVLKQWLHSHWEDPYPNAAIKAELAQQSGLTYDQVQHWFINARMRDWRPTLRKQNQQERQRSIEQQRLQQQQLHQQRGEETAQREQTDEENTE